MTAPDYAALRERLLDWAWLSEYANGGWEMQPAVTAKLKETCDKAAAAIAALVAERDQAEAECARRTHAWAADTQRAERAEAERDAAVSALAEMTQSRDNKWAELSAMTHRAITQEARAERAEATAAAYKVDAERYRTLRDHPCSAGPFVWADIMGETGYLPQGLDDELDRQRAARAAIEAGNK